MPSQVYVALPALPAKVHAALPPNVCGKRVWRERPRAIASTDWQGAPVDTATGVDQNVTSGSPRKSAMKLMKKNPKKITLMRSNA